MHGRDARDTWAIQNGSGAYNRSSMDETIREQLGRGPKVALTHQILHRNRTCTDGVPGTVLGRLRMRVGAVGMVGEDILGNAVMERLRGAGVDTSAVFGSAAAQTSASVVAVEPSGERCFFHTPGVTALIDADVFRRCFPIFKQCQWVQVGYFGLLPTLTADLPTVLRELKEFASQTRIGLDTVN